MKRLFLTALAAMSLLAIDIATTDKANAQSCRSLQFFCEHGPRGEGHCRRWRDMCGVDRDHDGRRDDWRRDWDREPWWQRERDRFDDRRRDRDDDRRHRDRDRDGDRDHRDRDRDGDRDHRDGGTNRHGGDHRPQGGGEHRPGGGEQPQR